MPLAIFDLDETLIKADSANMWSRYMQQQGLVNDPAFVERDHQFLAAYGRGELDMQEYMQFTLEPLKGMAEDKLNTYVSDFVSRDIPEVIYPQAKPLIDQLRNEGYRILVISATMEFLVSPIAATLGIEEIIGIKVATDPENCLTGETTGTLSFREGKITRLLEWLELQGENLAHARFYSDSINDLPLLELVDFPVATNPDSQLRQIAQQRNWPQLNWQLADTL